MEAIEKKYEPRIKYRIKFIELIYLGRKNVIKLGANDKLKRIINCKHKDVIIIGNKIIDLDALSYPLLVNFSIIPEYKVEP